METIFGEDLYNRNNSREIMHIERSQFYMALLYVERSRRKMIEKMLVLHSSIVSDSTWKKLKKNKLETICYKKDTYGFFIYCTEYENIPEDLKRCIAYARELGCVWLCLDIDAEVKIYVTYEDEFKGQYTEKEMLELYALVDKQEYPEYSCWITDMIRSGVFYEKV